MKLGIYSSASNFTSNKRPGSLGYETNDAADFASWGVDYLKYDSSYTGNVTAQTRFTTMEQALNSSGTPIFYAIGYSGASDVWSWANTTANSWRSTGAISNSWASMKSNFIANSLQAESAGQGAWTDPD
jgi:alpha-galactosidase